MDCVLRRNTDDNLRKDLRGQKDPSLQSMTRDVRTHRGWRWRKGEERKKSFPRDPRPGGKPEGVRGDPKGSDGPQVSTVDATIYRRPPVTTYRHRNTSGSGPTKAVKVAGSPPPEETVDGVSCVQVLG